MLRRFFAVILVTLVTTPFTAPFSTCDLVADNPLHQSDSLSAAKVAKDMAAIPFSASSDTRVELAASFDPAAPSLVVLIGQARSLVLRL